MYLITGCAGFIGFHMTNLLLNKGIEVIGIDNLNRYYSKDLKLKRLEILKKKNNFQFENLNLCKSNIDRFLIKYKNIKIIHFAAQPGVFNSYRILKAILTIILKQLII